MLVQSETGTDDGESAAGLAVKRPEGRRLDE
jgi:hypothetical protein